MAVSRARPIALRAPSGSGVSSGALARTWPSLIATGTGIVLVVSLAWSTGGYFPHSYLAAGAVAFAVLGVLLMLRPPYTVLTKQPLLALGSLIARAVWTGLATRWSTAPDTGLENMQRALLYVGLFALALIGAGSGRLARHIAWLVLVAIVVIVGAGLISRLYPDVIATSQAAQQL